MIAYTLLGAIGGALVGSYLFGGIGGCLFAFVFGIFGATIDGVRESHRDIRRWKREHTDTEVIR